MTVERFETRRDAEIAERQAIRLEKPEFNKIYSIGQAYEGQEKGGPMQPDELKAFRKALGLTQEEMGNAIGMSRKLIVEMEAGRAPIEQRTALALHHLALTEKFVAMRQELRTRTDLMKAGKFRLSRTDAEGTHDLTAETIVTNEANIAELDELIARGRALSRQD